MNRSSTLAVLPTLPVRMTDRGRAVMTRKFIDGMAKYSELWGGPVTAFMEPIAGTTTNLDEEEFDPAELPFRLEVISFVDPDLGRILAGHRLVLGAVYFRHNHLARTCRAVGVPCVYIAEYSLRTRYQVVRSSVTNPLKSARRHFWEWNQERQHRAAIRLAAGIQCNGTPTFEAYRGINPRPLLYFDTRGEESMLIAEDELAGRTAELRRGGPLRLLFSGRLIEMKGADDLVRVAAALRGLGVPFEMKICGGGALEPAIRAAIDRQGLGDQVGLAGVLNYKAELVPLTRRWADLFVCCHRTGDPSCTYLEVMSCGVPIVGYANEAFVGLARESGVGWATPMNRPDQLAARIAGLAGDRAALAAAATGALDFARRHTFDRTVRARVDHMKACAEPPRVAVGAG